MPKDGPIFVYVLRSLRDGRRYIGLSASVEERLKQHNTGKVKSTKSRKPFVLVHQELFANLAEARKRELYYKSSAGRSHLTEHGW
jgi:putative endonuclease